MLRCGQEGEWKRGNGRQAAVGEQLAVTGWPWLCCAASVLSTRQFSPVLCFPLAEVVALIGLWGCARAKKKWKYDKSLKIVYKASWPETAEKWIHSWLTRQSGSSALCFMEIYGECHKSYCTHMCYNNIMKNSLSKALKYIKAQVPSLHHLLPLPVETTPHMSVQCKKKNWHMRDSEAELDIDL